MHSGRNPCSLLRGVFNICFLSDKGQKTSGKNIIDLLEDNHYNFERTKRRYECL
jgi:hypothetical protein